MAVNLIFFSKNGRRKDIALDDGVTIIGRRPDCDIRIPLLYVSRKHCRFIRKDDQTVVQDLGSANGTFLNSERIMEAEVSAGDKVGVGIRRIRQCGFHDGNVLPVDPEDKKALGACQLEPDRPGKKDTVPLAIG